MRRRSLALLALALVFVAGCASAAQNTPSGAVGFGGGAVAPVPAAVDAAKRDVNGTTSASNPQNGIPTLASPGRDLIMTANVSFRSQDPWTTADKVRGIAAGLGGDLLALSQSGSGDQRSAVVTFRVPSSRFDDALGQLKQLDGEVVSSNVNAQDVTDQFVDMNARLAALKAQEQQYLTLLARASTVDEILKVQSALISVRTQIEQLQGQVNSLKSHIDYSTISMSITPVITVPSQPLGTWDPSRTFAQATAALAALFRVIGDAAIWLLVFVWVPLAALAVVAAAARVRRPVRTA